MLYFQIPASCGTLPVLLELEILDVQSQYNKLYQWLMMQIFVVTHTFF